MHHAMDVYRIICMIDQTQFKESIAFLQMRRNENAVETVKTIVEEYFSKIEAPGCLMIQEHPLYEKGFDMETLISILDEFFC